MPKHVLTSALVRARFRELIASQSSAAACLPIFILGLLQMDAILDIPMSVLAEHVAVCAEIHDALMGTPNRMRRLLEFILFYEAADSKPRGNQKRIVHPPTLCIGGLLLRPSRWVHSVSAS